MSTVIRALVDKVVVTQLVKKLPIFYRIRKFITVFRRTHTKNRIPGNFILLFWDIKEHRCLFMPSPVAAHTME